MRKSYSDSLNVGLTVVASLYQERGDRNMNQGLWVVVAVVVGTVAEISEVVAFSHHLLWY